MSQSLEEFYRGRRVLVTGGLGFIGSNLAHRLVKLGSRVSIVDALVPSHGGSYRNIGGIEDVVAVRVADMQSPRVAKEAVAGQEVIFNLMGQVSHVDSMANPRKDAEYNFLSHLSLLEACRRYNREAKVVYAGTRGQYGRPEYTPVDEGHPLRPIDVNGVNKQAAEGLHLVYHRAHGIRTVSLRLSNTYGPRQLMKHNRQGFIYWFVRQALEGQTIVIYGDGSQLRDFVYVDDVVDAFLLAGAREAADGEAFNVGSGRPTSVLEAAKLVIEACGRGGYRLMPFPEDRERIEIGDYYADTRKIERALGWRACVPLREGMRRTVAFFAGSDRYWALDQ